MVLLTPHRVSLLIWLVIPHLTSDSHPPASARVIRALSHESPASAARAMGRTPCSHEDSRRRRSAANARDGLVSPEAARALYGVVLTADGAVDVAATEQARAT